jgi:hypothetical protein
MVTALLMNHLLHGGAIETGHFILFKVFCVNVGEKKDNDCSE